MCVFWEYNLYVGVCVHENVCGCVCLSPLVSYNKWLSKGFEVAGWYLYSQECGKFCFCLSLEPEQEGLDSDAAKTRGRSVPWRAWLSNPNQISSSHHRFVIKVEVQVDVSKEWSGRIYIYIYSFYCWDKVEKKYKGTVFFVFFSADFVAPANLSRSSVLSVFYPLSLFLGLRNPHAVQFAHVSVLKQQLKKQEWTQVRLEWNGSGLIPCTTVVKPYQTEKPWMEEVKWSVMEHLECVVLSPSVVQTACVPVSVCVFVWI